MVLLFFALATLALVALGYIGGIDEGEQNATVTSSQTVQTWKSNSPESRIRATLAAGMQIAFTSPHTPPPKPGEAIVVRVRKTFFGWGSYTWQPGKAPAQ
jgi:hypothetical protein